MTDDAWASLVAAERDAAELRLRFSRSASMTTVIASSLEAGASVWEQRAALGFLHSFPSEIPNHVPRLFQLTLGERWEGEARELLAKGARSRIIAAVVQCAMDKIPLSDAEDYLHIAALLARLEERDTLKLAAAAAARSDKPEIREAGDFIRERYGVCI